MVCKLCATGRECNVIILTTVRSLPDDEILAHPSHNWVNKNLGFVTDEHLINVAITRAREALCIIGKNAAVCLVIIVCVLNNDKQNL